VQCAHVGEWWWAQALVGEGAEQEQQSENDERAHAGRAHRAAQVAPGAAHRDQRGWLGYMDAAILDWTQARDLPRAKLRELLIAAFVAALFAAQQADPKIRLGLD
jgi:hypothetical protein